jgi:hypothetical protein
MRVVAALLALAGCGTDSPPPVYADPNTIEVRFPAAGNRELDLLVVMDDTVGLPEVQADLTAHLPDFLARLSVIDGGQLPNLHIGVTTSDMGTLGSMTGVPGAPVGQVGSGGCTGSGDDGALLLAAGGAPFLTNDPDLATAFGALLRSAGGGGCGFEQHLHALRRSLTRTENAGFVRPAAALAIVIVADEDDCSMRTGDLVSPDTSVLGPLQSFRCTTQGVECDEPIDALGTKTNCRPREDSPYIESVATTIDFLERVKPPGQLVVTGIVGDASPFVVGPHTPPGGGAAIPGLDSVCTPALSGAVHPSPRLHAVISHFDARGTAPSICGTTTRPQLLEVARVIKPLLGVVCLDSSRLTDSSTDRGIQPACELTEIDGATETPLLDFTIAPDPVACPETADHLRLVVNRTDTPAAGAHIRARCETPF